MTTEATATTTCACSMFQSQGRCYHVGYRPFRDDRLSLDATARRTASFVDPKDIVETYKPLEAPNLTDAQRKEFEEKKRLLSARRRVLVPEAILRMHAWNEECDARYGPVDG
jgi:hypothetical protein